MREKQPHSNLQVKERDTNLRSGGFFILFIFNQSGVCVDLKKLSITKCTRLVSSRRL